MSRIVLATIAVTCSTPVSFVVSSNGNRLKALSRGWPKPSHGTCRTPIGSHQQLLVSTMTSGLPRTIRIDVRCERHHSGGGQRIASLPRNTLSQQASAAGLRQADDLLSAYHPDAGGDKRDTGDFHPRGPSPVSAPA